MWRDIVVITDLAASCRCGDPSVNVKCLKLHASLDVLWLGFVGGLLAGFSGGLKKPAPLARRLFTRQSSVVALCLHLCARSIQQQQQASGWGIPMM